MKSVVIFASLAFSFGPIGCGKGEAPAAPSPTTAEGAAGTSAHSDHGDGPLGETAHAGMNHGDMPMGEQAHGDRPMMGEHDPHGGTAPGAAGEAGAHGAIVTTYESVRHALATEDLQGAKDGAKALVTAAKDMHATVATAAAGIAEARDIAAARLAFGETSKALITVLSEMPMMAKGLHVFHCPMATGYQKWVQPSATLENPYMGQRMPTCGSASEMTP